MCLMHYYQEGVISGGRMVLVVTVGWGGGWGLGGGWGECVRGRENGCGVWKKS